MPVAKECHIQFKLLPGAYVTSGAHNDVDKRKRVGAGSAHATD